MSGLELLLPLSLVPNSSIMASRSIVLVCASWKSTLLPRICLLVLTRSISESAKHQILARVARVGSSIWVLLVLNYVGRWSSPPKISNRLLLLLLKVVGICWKKLQRF